MNIISIFPEMFQILKNYGVIAKALKNNLIQIKCWNPRNYTSSKRCNIDDKPYGGGPGMVMTAPPLIKAIKHAKLYPNSGTTKTIYLSPQGKILTQKNILTLSKNSKIILICGRYKGIDQRVIDLEVDEEYSIGHFVISGGELAAMIFIDSLVRIKPGVLNTTQSFESDSFFNNRLDYPNYTRPYLVEGKTVPEILLSGNHEKIKQWREKEAIKQTWKKHPQLFKKNLTNNEILLVNSLKKENNKT
ncbi:tRNA (guanine-N(1)-)-methyltransferase [Buchnera aphidicola (Eriosoma lanigerum)]